MNHSSAIRRSIILCGLLLLLLLGIRHGFSSVSQTSVQQQEETLTRALQRSLTSYYALEGSYPRSLRELTEVCPLSYDEELFFIDYQPVSANLPPDITIINRRQP